MNNAYRATLCTHQAETDVVVAIASVVVVALGGTQVLRVVVPTAPAEHAVRA